MKKSRLYLGEMEEVTKKYAQDIIKEIEGHLAKDFWTESDFQSFIIQTLEAMYQELKPYNEVNEEYEYFTNSFGIKMKRLKK